MDYANEARNLKEIVRRLARTERWPNGKLPCDYLVLDTETTGTNSSADSIVQIGFCLVRDCKISHDMWDSDTMSYTLKLPREKFIGKEAAINVHHIDFEKSQRCGIEPAEAYKMLYEVVQAAKAQGLLVCGHNLYSFDVPFFQTELARLGINFKFAPNEVIDTAMLVKAMQVGILPGEDETSYAYWSRVHAYRAKGVYFNLDRHCMGRFELHKHGASKDHAHDAGYDCWLAHLVVEELNKIVTS